MRIVCIGFFAPDYLISLANALGQTNAVTLFLAEQDLAMRFPRSSDVKATLRLQRILDPTVSLRLVNYPEGDYLQKLRVVRELVRAVRALQPDVVHYHPGGSPWVSLAMLWLRRFPLVATIHDASHHLGDWPPSVSVVAINYLTTRLAHQVIVHGRQQASVLIQRHRVATGKVNVVPLGPPEVFTALTNGRVTPDSRTVLFFGRLRAYKGVEVLIRAAPLIAAQVPDVRIVIAGSGEYPAVHQAAREHPQWFEVHNRFIAAEEVPHFFQWAAVVVQPYLEATQSGVLPLAYLFGRPVVATRVGSIPEVLDGGQTGYLVEPGDERALAEAVIRLLKDPALREAMGQAAVAKLQHDLSWNAIAAKTLTVYERARWCAYQAPLAPREVST